MPMQSPDDDLKRRQVAWDAMHVLFLDTDVDRFYFDDAAKKCADTDYSLNELEQIYWCEVYPTMRFNLWQVAGEWTPSDIESLSDAILERHKFGKRIWFRHLRRYPFEYWKKLRSEVQNLRSSR